MYQRVYKRYRRMLADAVNDEVFLIEKGCSIYFRETPETHTEIRETKK